MNEIDSLTGTAGAGTPMGSHGGSMRLAVIDFDSGFVRVLEKRMEGIGWQFRTLGSPVPPDDLVAMRINCLVVDLALLGPQAWDFLKRVCEGIPGLGVIVCTQRSTVAQRVRGLRLGADDWVGKPCHPEEVIARVEAVVRRRRRTMARQETGPVHAGELEIRADQFQAFVGGRSLELTRREFELLQLLSDARGQVMQREEIYQRVWGYAMAHGDRSVDVFVRKLRQKLEVASPTWRYIHTHFGIGYRLDPEPVDGDDVVELPAMAWDLERVAATVAADLPEIEGVEADEPSTSASPSTTEIARARESAGVGGR
jgi:DNA-binding response OmpR family regulator